MKAIAILNLKGGVAKTVTAINMAHILATDYHKKVLLIDADSQHNTTDFFGAGDPDNNLSAILKGVSEPHYEESIYQTEVPGLHILPGDDGLMDLDISCVRDGRINTYAMVDLLTALSEDDAYDLVIVDCPPAFNAASTAALAAVSEVIIPAKPDPFSIAGLSNMIRQIQSMHAINPGLHVRGVLLTMWTKECADAEKQLREYSSRMLPVFKTVIRHSGKMVDGLFAGEAITAYSPHSAAGIDYRKFVREYLGEVQA